MRLLQGGNREDVPLPGAVGAAVLSVALPLRARRNRGEATEQAGQRHRKAGVRRPTGEGEESFWSVAEISRRQQAKLLERRATVSFRPSLATQGKEKKRTSC